ncbi:MAG: class I SAM-dependent methyltransferase [Chloroflexi bacterium]|nr:class I SAM-dependent methyltransferase [Chloroflexota bacterium]
MAEVERIRQAYARREQEGKRARYSYFHPWDLLASQQRERVLLRALRRAGLESLGDKRILEVGCGRGGVLRRFLEFGALPENLYGVDLLPDRIEEARRLQPNAHFSCGNAEQLPYEDGFFHIVLQFTAFTSILDPDMKRNVAREMLRVLQPQGIILWYDYSVDNPRNPDVRGVGRKEISRLFPGCQVSLTRLTLAPPLSRFISGPLPTLAYVLQSVPLLCTHYLGVIRR